MNVVASGFGFSHRGLDAPRELREALRELDLAVFRWVRAHGGGSELATAAAWASYAQGQGDVALMLDAEHAKRLGIADINPLRTAIESLADDAQNPWIERIGVGNTSTAKAPFVLDHDAFYLRRNFLHETTVARLLRERLTATSTPSQTLADDELRELFNGQWTNEEAPQREAVQRVIGKHLFVLTGGPGTGKTTTVLRMVLALARTHLSQHGAAPVIRLAAPTGKAAQRLHDALHEGMARLATQLPQAWQPALDVAKSAESSTLHRLLGSRGRAGFAQHPGNRLAADIVIVDEASMIDLHLLRALLQALRKPAVLVLLGDANQLAPVGTGSALADLVAALDGRENLVRLEHSFRAEAHLATINTAVREGDAEAFEAAWHAAGDSAKHLPVPDLRSLRIRLAQWLEHLHQRLAHSGAFALHEASDITSQRCALAALKTQQLLCALREGAFGAVEANRQLELNLRRHAALADWQGSAWYPGRAVIITRNDESSGLFNGDVGLCLHLRDADGRTHLAVAFASPQQDEAPRLFDPNHLPEHETAFALTVHKSQGSEYESVAVLLPPQDEHPLLLRQMLYTALSRAKTHIQLWAEPQSLAACLATQPLRAGRLMQRL